ncbi:uncharacterized protein LOC115760170 [Drosophila novamexicana]|uniref:uncharacterized protein LOC115760170 n=1 Tax=Drosophila novamexicana TaxID=47314 RepID=UPI0011E5EC2C|nr:uncharacterized protein LOC115760170 [Drosophila novamexicana]
MPSLTKRFSFKKRRNGPGAANEEGNGDGGTSNNLTDEEIIPGPPAEGDMPTFFHIGSLAKQCLISGYKIGTWHIDCTTKVKDKVTLFSYGSGKPNFDNVWGGVGMRQKWGIWDLFQVWQTDNIMGAVGGQSKLVGGTANAMLWAIYNPHDGSGVKLQVYSGYERSPIKFDLIIPVLNVPRLMGYALLHIAKNWLLAFRMDYDIAERAIQKHAICGGYYNGSTELGLKFEDFKDWRGSIFQRLGKRWAVAFKADLYTEEPRQYAVGGQYQINDNSLLKATVRDNGFLGLVYQLNLTENIGITYHVGLELKDPIKGEHRVGISCSLRA